MVDVNAVSAGRGDLQAQTAHTYAFHFGYLQPSLCQRNHQIDLGLTSLLF